MSKKQNKKLFYDWLNVEPWHPLFYADGGEASKRREGPIIDKAVKFEITNINDYMIANAKQFCGSQDTDVEGEGYYTIDLTNRIVASPPFEKMWFEYTALTTPVPFTVDDNGNKRVGEGLSDVPYYCQVGILMRHIDFDTHPDGRRIAELFGKTTDGNGKQLFPLTKDSRWFLYTTSWQRSKHQNRTIIMGPGFDVAFIVNKHGLVTTSRILPHYNRDDWPHRPKLPGLVGSDQADAMSKVVPALFALTFMNCRNVETVEREPSHSMSKKHEKKHGKPLTKYSMLRIDVTKTRVQAVGKNDPGAIGSDMPFHICRGHFRIYSEEKPLFGHYVGPIWVPAHIRGNEKVGSVVHDYKLEGLNAGEEA